MTLEDQWTGRRSARCRLPPCLLVSAWCLLVGHAWAQNNIPSPGELVPKAVPPEAPREEPSLPERVPDLETTKLDANLELTIVRFKLAGADPALVALAQQQLAPLQEHKIRIGAIYGAIAKLEQSWVNRGHFLTRIIIPPQHVAEGGEMQLQVIRGFIQWVDVDAVPVEQRARVASILAPLVNDPHIGRVQFERALLVASELPGVSLSASLRTGPDVGAVILVVSGEEHHEHGELAVDNTLPKLLGRTSATLSSTAIAPEGPIDEFYFTGSVPVTSNPFRSSSPRTLLIGGVRSGVGVDGAGIDANLTWSRTKPESEPGVLDTESSFKRATVRGTYPLIKTRATTVVTDVGFDATEERETASQFGKPLYDDQLRVLRAGVAATRVFSLAWQGAAGIEVSRGVHALGARAPSQATADDPLSQQGASDVFTKLEWHASIHRELPANLGLDMQLHGQQTSHPLLLAEKFTLGGPSDLSAYDTASFSGDRGWAFRGELQRHLASRFWSLSENAQAYFFAARGQAVTIEPTSVEQRTSTGSSAGIGIRTSATAADHRFGPFEVSGEVAREFNPATPPLPDHWRVHFSVAIHF